MCYEEFMMMINQTEILLIVKAGTAEMGGIFNVSMMTQVDEISNDKHIRMSEIEFMEAIVRVANVLDKYPDCIYRRRKSIL